MAIEILKRDAWMPEEAERAIRHYTPKTDLGAVAMRVILNGYGIPLEERHALFEILRRSVVVESELRLAVYRTPESLYRVDRGLVTPGDLRNWGVKVASDGLIEYWGVVSKKLVTDNGVGLIVDTFDNTVTAGDCRYHGIGTDATAEAQTDSALIAELTTEYNPNSTRATGTFSQPAANQSRSVATNTVDASVNLREHAPFTQAATGGGVCFDRSIYASVNLSSGDSLQSTYTVTIAAGG